jgi:hypothetical protein
MIQVDEKKTGVGFSRKLSYQEALRGAILDYAWNPSGAEEEVTLTVVGARVEVGGPLGEATLFVTVGQGK